MEVVMGLLKRGSLLLLFLGLLLFIPEKSYASYSCRGATAPGVSVMVCQDGYTVLTLFDADGNVTYSWHGYS